MIYEEFVLIQGTKDYYVSKQGNIKHINKPIGFKTPNGYLVALRLNDSTRIVNIRRIVAETFIPNPKNYPWVKHRDNNVFNCAVENLFWTPRTVSTWLGKFGKNHNKSIPVCQYNLDGQFLAEWDSITGASVATGVDGGNITRVCKKQRTRAGKYLWKYKNY